MLSVSRAKPCQWVKMKDFFALARKAPNSSGKKNKNLGLAVGLERMSGILEFVS